MLGTPWDTTIPGCIKDGIPTLACIPALFQNLVAAAIIFAGTVALFFIIWAGIKLIRSAGDPKQVEGAKKTLTYAIIGLILVLLSFFILSFISMVTGVECIQTIGFTNCD